MHKKRRLEAFVRYTSGRNKTVLTSGHFDQCDESYTFISQPPYSTWRLEILQYKCWYLCNCTTIAFKWLLHLSRSGSLFFFLQWIQFIVLSVAVLPALCIYLLAVGADFSLRDLGFGEPLPSHVATYRTDLGLPHRDYSVSVGSDADTETDGIMSPEHAVRLWGRSNTKSGRSSCLSSRANSNLTLTDTEHENTENGRTLPSFACLCQSFSGQQIFAPCIFPCGVDFGIEI